MLAFAFALATAALAIQGIFQPLLPFLAYAPVISLFILRTSLAATLFASAGCGALIDLLSDDPMGVHALNYTITAAFFYRFRRHFSHDQPLHLSLFSAAVSLFSTVLLLFLLFLFDRRVPFHGKWAVADLAGLPLLDALYAFVWIAAPLALFEKLRRLWVVHRAKRLLENG